VSYLFRNAGHLYHEKQISKLGGSKRTVSDGERKKMNKAAITKHEIYNNLIDFSEQDLDAIANDPVIRDSSFVEILE
jgi:hypothetical protein